MVGDRVRCVVQIVLSFGRGGLETMAVGLGCALRRRGLRSVMIALDEGGQLEPQLREAGVEYHVLGGRKLRDPRFHWRLASLVRRLRPDVVHSHNFAPLLHAAVVRRVGATPRLVHTEHAFEYLAEHPRYWPWIRLAGNQCDAFAVVGSRLAPFFIDRVGLPPSRVQTVPNGIDTDGFRRSADRAAVRRSLGLPGGFLLGTVGRFAAEKDYATLVAGFHRLRAQRPDARLIMLGDGVERDALERQVRSLGLESDVSFLGWRRDVASIVSALDVFALTSANEGLPLALLEAMACEVTPVCTPVGDIPVVVTDGVNGRTFPVGDANRLATIVRELASTPALRARLGAAARDTVERSYSHDTMVQHYLRVYGFGGAQPTPYPDRRFPAGRLPTSAQPDLG